MHSSQHTFRSIANSALIAGAAALMSLSCHAETASSGQATTAVGTLQTVIVRAEKVRESVQKTALSLTVLSGKDLVKAGISNLEQVQNFVPNVRFQEEGAGIREIYIRGVGSTNDTPTEDPPNSYNFNGVYVPRIATGVALYDISNVVVIPGPQSTLYGRSSLGGTVNVTANRPVSGFEASGQIEAGNYRRLQTTAVLNVPLSKSLWVRLAANHISHDGYETSGAYSQNENGGRLSFLYRPDDQLSVYLWGTYDSQGGYGPNLVNKGLDPITGTVTPATANSYLHNNRWNDLIPAAFRGPFPAVTAQPLRYHTWTVSGQVDYQFGTLKLTYIPSYTSIYMNRHYNFTALPLNFPIKNDQETNELRLANEGEGAWKWLVGFYQYHFYTRAHLFANLSSIGFGYFDLYHDPHSRTHGEAAFGQVTYSVTPKLRLTVGGRYSHDFRHAWGVATPLPWEGRKTFVSFDWKAGINYDLARNSMIYLTAQTGSQLGTFTDFPSTPTQSNLVKSPHLLSVALGSKNRFLDNHLQVNDEFFLYNYHNFIVDAFDAQLGSLTSSAKRMRIFGDELDLNALLPGNNEINASIGYLHARYTSFDSSFPAADTGGVTNFDGYQAQYAPNWSISAGMQHVIYFNSGSSLNARVNTHYESSYWASFWHPLGGQQQPYTRTDASLTYEAASGNWSVALWAHNLENAAVMEASATGAVPGPIGTFLAPPRTYGIRVTAKFSH